MTSAKITLLALAAASTLAFGAGAHAATINGLYSTGVDNSGVAVTGNGADEHWTLDGGAAYTGGVTGEFPIGPWVADSGVSRWITPTSNAGQSFDPTSAGFYTYETSFSLTGAQAAAASLTGQFAVDNTVVDILLNGHSLGAGGGFSGWTGFSASSGDFVAGANNLQFVVENYAQNGGNPTGVNVQILSSSTVAVPEPASWALMMVGVGGVGAALRRRPEAMSAAAS